MYDQMPSGIHFNKASSVTLGYNQKNTSAVPTFRLLPPPFNFRSNRGSRSPKYFKFTWPSVPARWPCTLVAPHRDIGHSRLMLPSVEHIKIPESGPWNLQNTWQFLRSTVGNSGKYIIRNYRFAWEIETNIP